MSRAGHTILPAFPPAVIVPRGGMTLYSCVRPRIVVRARVVNAFT